MDRNLPSFLTHNTHTHTNTNWLVSPSIFHGLCLTSSEAQKLSSSAAQQLGFGWPTRPYGAANRRAVNRPIHHVPIASKNKKRTDPVTLAASETKEEWRKRERDNNKNGTACSMIYSSSIISSPWRGAVKKKTRGATATSSSCSSSLTRFYFSFHFGPTRFVKKNTNGKKSKKSENHIFFRFFFNIWPVLIGLRPSPGRGNRSAVDFHRVP